MGFLKHLITLSDKISQSDLTLHFASTNDFDYQVIRNNNLEKHMQNMSERHSTWELSYPYKSCNTNMFATCYNGHWKQIKKKKPVKLLIKFYSKSYTIIQKRSLRSSFFNDIEIHQHVRLRYV